MSGKSHLVMCPVVATCKNAVVATCTSLCLLHPNRVYNKMATYMACELHLWNFWWKIVAY